MDSPTILVDAAILKPGLGGIATFTTELIGAIAARLNVIVVTSMPEAVNVPGVQVVELPPVVRKFAARAAWREAFLAPLISRVKADVLFSPVPEVPLKRPSIPIVAVVHDVNPVLAPALFGSAKWLRYRLGFQHVMATADAVVCDSHATRLSLHCVTSSDTRKTRVIPLGPQSLPAPRSVPPHETPYVLAVGSMMAHKNLEVLPGTMRRMGSSAPLDLLLTGPTDPSSLTRFNSRCAEEGVADRVHHLGLVDPATLATLYRHTVGLVFPSMIEGFGLPVLEAMRSGAPVICAPLPCVREVAGDAAIYVDDIFSEDAWASGIARLVQDQGLQARLSASGRSRAQLFSWELAGPSYIRLLTDVQGRPAPSRLSRSS